LIDASAAALGLQIDPEWRAAIKASRPKGFLCEAEGLSRARDISSFGGWRAYVASNGCKELRGLRTSD
jgi:hypothetical protein